jgi:general secretion pathway protein K
MAYICHHRGRRPQRGVALLTAIFVVALATIAATALATSAAIAVRRTENMQTEEVARWYAEGVESWVKSMLAQDASQNKKYTALSDPWAQPVAFIPIDNGGIRGQVVDLRGLFNLNSLADKNQKTAARNMTIFRQLLENLPDFDPTGSTGIGDAIKDWIDADDQRSGTSGAEDGDYLGLVPPYRAANQLMHSVSELNAIFGMTPKLYAALKPYVCTLPDTSLKINVNTAPAPVLMALSQEMDGERLKGFLAARLKQPVENIGDLGRDNFLPNDIPAGVLDVSSDYFELHQEVIVGSARVALYSVIYRPSNGTPLVIAHSTDSD